MSASSDPPTEMDVRGLKAILQQLREGLVDLEKMVHGDPAQEQSQPGLVSQVKGLSDALGAIASSIDTATTHIGGITDLGNKLKSLQDALDSSQSGDVGLADRLSKVATRIADLQAMLRTKPGTSSWSSRTLLVPFLTWWVLCIATLVITAVLGYSWKGSSSARSFVGLSRFMADNAVPLTFTGGIVGFAAGVLAVLSEKLTRAASLTKAASEGLIKGGAAALAVLTIVGGVKAVEYFVLGSGPQVVFIGSGTVHRYLFGSAAGARGIPADGRPLGPHDVRFWAFEGESVGGVNFTAYAYDHHSKRMHELRVPLIGMAAADVLNDQGNGWTSNGEDYFRCEMRNSDPDYDDFAVIPIKPNLPPEWYVSSTEAVKGLDHLPALCRTNEGEDNGCEWAYFPRETDPVFHLPRGGSGTLGSIIWEGLCPATVVERVGNRDQVLVKTLVSKPSNFSLDLSHIKVNGKEVHAALGNYALPTNTHDWTSLPCEGCKPRDLVLLVPVEEEGTKELRIWRPLPYVCLALMVLQENGLSLKQYVDFDQCGSKLSDPSDCRCRLTTETFLLEGTAEDDGRLTCRPLPTPPVCKATSGIAAP